MMRRSLLFLAALGTLAVITALGPSKQVPLLLLDWASKAQVETPPVAILIEMGLKDDKPTSWSGRATVTGAKVVHREGYRFRDTDKLVEPNGWEVSSHRQPQLQRANPALNQVARPASVGVVLYLADVQPDAALTLEAKDQDSAKVTVPLSEVLASRPRLIRDGAVAVKRVAAAMPVVTAKTEDDFPAAAYGPDGTLWVAYISYTLKQEQRRLQWMALDQQPADFKAFFHPEFGDQLFVKSFRAGKWSEPIALTGPREDLVRCAVGVEGTGDVWVAYSANRQGSYHLYARALPGRDAAPQPGPERQLTKTTGPDLGPVMCTDQAGQVWLAYQAWSGPAGARIALLRCRDGRWTEGPALPHGQPGENQWYPALAAGPAGQVAVAYDVYQEGDYDVQVAVVKGDRAETFPVAASAAFEARPALAYDAQGRLWIAHEQGPDNWGKDFGALDKDRGNPLYNVRTVRVACLEDGKLSKPAAEPPTAEKLRQAGGGRTGVLAYPRVGLDGRGRLWLSYRQKLATPFGTQPGTNWLTVACRLDGDHWSAGVDVFHSDGLLDSRPVLLPHASGGLLVVTNTDGRYVTPGVIDNQVYAAVVDLPGTPAEAKLVAHSPGTKDGTRAGEERAAVQRIRDYRAEMSGKKYHLLRGEFHRHTEISFDGGGDGSLEDMFRYALDAAALDWIGNTDHDSGWGREYPWWLIQKFSDAYHVAGAFTPMFAYERSVRYPHGHRNCIFAKRGILTLPRLAQPDPDKRVAAVHADDTKMLYRYLKELDGVCASHTSATSMGTDWRDNDPQVEPIVEIYQGDRNSYEYPNAPRAGHDPKGNELPASIGGWEPAGFLNHALKEKGYRLGFQSSSDHISTNISYCVVLAERPEREEILTALKKRRCYAATDDIVLDVRSGDHLMGEEFKTAAAPTLQLTVIGTKPLSRVDIIKDSKVLETLKATGREYRGSWTDPHPEAGVHYYYVRVTQADEQLAWSSPMWIDYGRGR